MTKQKNKKNFKCTKGVYFLASVYFAPIKNSEHLTLKHYVSPVEGRIYEINGIKFGISKYNDYNVVDYKSGVLISGSRTKIFHSYKEFENNIEEFYDIFKKNEPEEKVKETMEVYKKLIQDYKEKLKTAGIVVKE